MTEDLYREVFAAFSISKYKSDYVFNYEEEEKKLQNDPVMKEGQEGFK